MNLEKIERRCLELLKKSQRALIPFSTVLDYVRKDKDAATIKPEELLTFLRHHELFRVFDPVSGLSGLNPSDKGSAFLKEPSVALCTRLPSTHEIQTLMREQLDDLIKALEGALEEGTIEDPIKEEQLSFLLERAYSLRKKLEKNGG